MSKLYGLIGEKLGHSFSPQIHREIFKLLGINGEYRLFELEENELEAAVRRFREQGISGLNVTVPYKVKIKAYLDEISSEAEKIGAVNTITIADGKAKGYNTDYCGFGMSLEKSGIGVAGKSFVILGTGGASRAVIQYLEDNLARDITYVSRKPGDGASTGSFKIKTVGYNEIASLGGDVIINCTPCGMFPAVEETPVSAAMLDSFNTAFDLIYNPEETVFLKLARERGLKTVNGLYMLVGQAVAAEELWNGVSLTEAQVEVVYRAVESMLYEKDKGERNE